MFHNRARLIGGEKVKPHWLEASDAFWYCDEGPPQRRFFLVNPAKGERLPAFDHERLARSLQDAAGSPVDSAALPFAAIELKNDAVEFDAFNAHWRCRLDSYQCERVAGHVYPNPLEVRSPDGRWAVFRRGYDLWIRSTASGEERPITTDGTADLSYGFTPDCLSFRVLMRRFGLPYFPPLVAWSPDSRRLVTHRTDQRDVRLTHLMEAAPADGGPPVLHTYRFAVPGDAQIPRAEIFVYDIDAASSVFAKAEPVLMPVVSPLLYSAMWWGTDGSAVYYLDQPRDLRTLSLKRLDPRTGAVRTLVQESGEPRVDSTPYAGSKPLVRVVSNGAEVIWYSQRDGWGHLYLYDAASGNLRCQLTSGEWAVQDILHVDERKRVVYFLAAGLVASDPYRRQVCRVGLDGKNFARVHADELDHAVTVAKSGTYYIDSASTIEMPPVITVRDWDGRALVELGSANVSRLVQAGWTAPERFCVKAADGKTDIYGVIYRPHGLDTTQRYPVIDHPYPGPQFNRVAPAFGEQVPFYHSDSLAALGFVVVCVDGRGTPGRSKAFHDLSYGHLDKAGYLEDHIAALRQLAQTRPWMDLNRVGIYGYSAGGYATVRAMCTYPDFFKVGVAICGTHEQRYGQLSWGETYLGQPENNGAYERASNSELADRLSGPLLLIHGELDDNVHPHLTMRLVERLIAANKDFDLLIIPGAEHLLIGFGHYINRRLWDYFVRHLHGMEPPRGYQLADIRPDISAFFG